MKLPNIKVPKKITPCPIVDAVVELRFDSAVPADAIPGIVFERFKSSFPTLEKLPIMELPSAFRESNPQLIYSPYYKLPSDKYVFQIGPRVCSVSCPKEYQGWSNFNEQINMIFAGIRELGIVKKPLRIGLRYINFFENINIFDKLNIGITFDSQSLESDKNILRTEFKAEKFIEVLQITNTAQLNNALTGSMIDTDVILEGDESSLTDFKNIIEAAHGIEKRIFFGILKKEYLETFSPQY